MTRSKAENDVNRSGSQVGELDCGGWHNGASLPNHMDACTFSLNLRRGVLAYPLLVSHSATLSRSEARLIAGRTNLSLKTPSIHQNYSGKVQCSEDLDTMYRLDTAVIIP